MAAAALAKFRTKIFQDPIALQKYVTADNSLVNTITAITYDAASGAYILFYMIA